MYNGSLTYYAYIKSSKDRDRKYVTPLMMICPVLSSQNHSTFCVGCAMFLLVAGLDKYELSNKSFCNGNYLLVHL